MTWKLLLIATLLALTAQPVLAGYSPHWENPLTVQPNDVTETEMQVYAPYDNTGALVTVSVSGNLSNHVTATPQRFSLGPADTANDTRTVRFFVNSEGLTTGETVTGTITITYKSSTDAHGSTVIMKDTADMTVTAATPSTHSSPPYLGIGVLAALLAGLLLLWRYR